MTPFRTRKGGVYLTRVRNAAGLTKRVSTGTADRRTALDVEAMVQRFVARREWAPLDAILAGRATLPEVYDADRAGTLAALLAAASEVDLAPMVAEWAATGVPAKYVTQVRRFIPAGERFPVSRFTRAAVRLFLDRLTRIHRTAGDTAKPASNSTRNRYRAALSVFARWLVERDVLPANPVREVRAAPTKGPRLLHLTPKQAKALVASFPMGSEMQLLEAWMYGSGVELGALLNARRRDVDYMERTLHCFPGHDGDEGKTKYRSRIVEVTEDWAWDVILTWTRHATPNARLFVIDGDKAHRDHDARIKALGLPPVTLHDARHTYAITALKRGDDHQAIKRQLGHAPQSTLIYTTYGVYLTAPKKRRKGDGETPIQAPTVPTEV